MKATLNENELYNVIYEATKTILLNVPLYERTHRPLELIQRGLHPMNEASINRILSHGQQGFIVISGVRNECADMALLKDIQDKGYAWSKVYGGNHGSDNVGDSYEPNYIVYNHDRSYLRNYGDWQKLLDFAIEMCGKYNQESVYVQAPNEAPIWVNMDNITEPIHFENFLTISGPSTYNGRIRRRFFGEVFLDE